MHFIVVITTRLLQYITVVQKDLYSFAIFFDRTTKWTLISILKITTICPIDLCHNFYDVQQAVIYFSL